MTTWLVVLAVAVGSYALRSLPVALGARWNASPAFERAAGHGATAALAALIAAGIRRDATDPSSAVALGAAVVVAMVLAWRGASLPRVLVAGVAVNGVVTAALLLW